jgi:S-ribosylhomocysteine lyase LuxS involved in autoinducer biosynthesis
MRTGFGLNVTTESNKKQIITKIFTKLDKVISARSKLTQIPESNLRF